MTLEQQKYPIGEFKAPSKYTEQTLQEAITILEIFPLKLRDLTATLSEAALEGTYREGSWTIRQVVHHLADSHHNSYMRFKWALTEDNPVIKAYDEKAWADLPQSKTSPVAWSLTHIEVVHQKMVQMLKGFKKPEWNRTFQHPETKHTFTLKELACMYAWHSMHHFMHIKNAL